MVNIMSNDVNRFDTSVLFIHYIWIGPIQTFITAAILCKIIGPSCFVGLAVLIIFVPLQSIIANSVFLQLLKNNFFQIKKGWMSRVFSQLRMETALRTDERIRTMNEILSGMRVIKLYSWEKYFAKLIEFLRRYAI